MAQFRLHPNLAAGAIGAQKLIEWKLVVNDSGVYLPVCHFCEEAEKMLISW